MPFNKGQVFAIILLMIKNVLHIGGKHCYFCKHGDSREHGNSRAEKALSLASFEEARFFLLLRNSQLNVPYRGSMRVGR